MFANVQHINLFLYILLLIDGIFIQLFCVDLYYRIQGLYSMTNSVILSCCVLSLKSSFIAHLANLEYEYRWTRSQGRPAPSYCRTTRSNDLIYQMHFVPALSVAI